MVATGVAIITALFSAKVMRYLGQTGKSHFTIDEINDVFGKTSYQMVKKLTEAERDVAQAKKEKSMNEVKDVIENLFNGEAKPGKN